MLYVNLSAVKKHSKVLYTYTEMRMDKKLFSWLGEK